MQIPLPLAHLLSSRLSFYITDDCSGLIAGFSVVPFETLKGEGLGLGFRDAGLGFRV